MKTTGQILRETRISKKLEIEDVARITKIRARQLLLLEEDDYQRLPDATVARGFIQNYAQYLGLNPEHILAVFRRDFIENERGQIIPRGMVESINHLSFWTPKSTIIAGVVLIFTVFAGYLGYQYYLLTGPPQLALSQPKDNVSVTESSIEIIGTTDPEATLSVNGHDVVLEKGGRFDFRFSLEPGTNQVSVTAVGKSGKSVTLTRKIILTTRP
jgi:cytoskeletal protein RodZ